MDSGAHQDHPFIAEGTVAEIFEASGEPRVRIVLRAGMMLDLPLSCVRDVHLGQQLDVAGIIRVELVQLRAMSIAGDPST